MGRTLIAGWVLLWWVWPLLRALAVAGELPPYAVARLPTPVFSDPEFPKLFGGSDGRTLVRDRCGQIRSLEFIAPVGSVFTVRGMVPGSSPAVWRVTTAEYPYPAPGGILCRSTASSPRRRRNRPSGSATSPRGESPPAARGVNRGALCLGRQPPRRPPGTAHPLSAVVTPFRRRRRGLDPGGAGLLRPLVRGHRGCYPPEYLGPHRLWQKCHRCRPGRPGNRGCAASP